MFREVLRKVCLEALPQVSILEVSSVADALTAVHERPPDLAIVDLILPDGSGFDVISWGCSVYREMKCLIVSAHCDEYTVHLTRQSSALGFVDKSNSSLMTLRDAIKSVASGRPFFSERYQATAIRVLTAQDAFYRILSITELRVLSLIADGFADCEIAEALGIAAATAKTHRSSILRKLNIPSTPKLIAFAQAHGV